MSVINTTSDDNVGIKELERRKYFLYTINFAKSGLILILLIKGVRGGVNIFVLDFVHTFFNGN